MAESWMGSIEPNKPLPGLNYEITYITEYGNVASTSVSTLTASELPTLTQENYDFGGWFYEETYETQAMVGDTLSADTTLYAKWTKSAIVKLAPFFTGIANAIRAKKGTTGIINAQDFASEIESIESGGGTSGESKGFTLELTEGTSSLFDCDSKIKFGSAPTSNDDYDLSSGIGVFMLNPTTMSFTLSKTIYAFGDAFVNINGQQYTLSTSNMGAYRDYTNAIKIELDELPYHINLHGWRGMGGGA